MHSNKNPFLSHSVIALLIEDRKYKEHKQNVKS